jgi:hypothetical protein
MTTETLWDIPARSPKSTYEKWDRENPQAYAEFRKLTLRLIRRGIKHYGAKAICEVIRFHTAIHSQGTFRVNNSVISYYARKFMREFPQHKDFFETRRSKLDFA